MRSYTRLRDFQQDFKKIAGLAGRLAEDLTGSIDQAQAKRILNSALDWVRPFHLAIGFRVRKLSRSQVEAFIPARAHNLASSGEVEEAVVISVARQMAQLLIARWEVPADFELDQLQFSRLQKMKGDLIVRLEWEELSREGLRAELYKNQVALQEWVVTVSDLEEKRVAHVHLNFKLRLPQNLSGKGSHGDHSERS
ncbi:MAG: hypothetical protein ACK5P7_02280 [Bdellovibrio sp.]|jgi:hypothetical protein